MAKSKRKQKRKDKRKKLKTQVASVTESPVEKHASLLWAGGDDTYRNNWWQLGAHGVTGEGAVEFSPVFSCTQIIAQELAKVPLHHWRKEQNGRRTEVNSAIIRVLNSPNPIQTRSDFTLFMALSLLLQGNAYAWAVRDVRGTIVELWPISAAATSPRVVPETGEIWYQTPQIFEYMPHLDPGGMIPAQDMIHLRVFCPSNPLIGVTPLVSAITAVDTGLAIEEFGNAFFSRQARPGGILRTNERLGPDVAKKLARMWADATSGHSSGGTAVLDRGLEWQPLTMTAVDAELIQQYKLKREQIAEIYRVPLFMLGDYTDTSFNNIETMTRVFYSSCLGFYLEHLEQAFHKFFGMGPQEKLEYDVEASLLRPEFKARMEGYARGIQGGVLMPDEARRRENLPPVPGGDTCFLQAQMISVEAASQSEPQRVGAGAGDASAGDNEDDDDDQEKRLREAIDYQLQGAIH